MAAYDPTQNPSSKQFVDRNPGEVVLRDLYETQRLTTRAIAKQFDVRRITVSRWLKAFGIDARASSRGLANRGIQGPTKDELDYMLHVEYLGYQGVSEKFGVDSSAVMHWVKKHGIEPPTIWETRSKGTRPKIDPEQVRQLYESGLSQDEIGARFGVGGIVIRLIFKKHDIEARPGGINKTTYTCTNGLVVKSSYEARVAEWLITHDLEFAYEPKYPFSQVLRADFLVNGWYIEIWGLTNWESYRIQRDRKINLCRIHGIPLIQFNAEIFHANRQKAFERRIEEVLISVKGPNMLF